MKPGKTVALVAIAAAIGALVAVASPANATNIGRNGCSPGYWKAHPAAWQEYVPTSRLGHNWTIPPWFAGQSNNTFMQALRYHGGPGAEGAARILFRSAVAAYLNAAHEGVGYPYRRFKEPGTLEGRINAALRSGSRIRMLALVAVLDLANNLGCPLK